MFKWLAGIVLAGVTFTSQANIVILGTRVIYPSDQKNISVQLTNKGSLPSLVQSWIDNGDEKADPNKLKLPFVITPPVSRVDPQKQQTLRISYTGEPLAKDRETLFFFNVLDIPPKPSKESLEKNPNYLQFSVRSRLKFFFRPANLPYPVEDAYHKVGWKISGKQITVNNPTPYFITYSKVAVKQGNKSVATRDADMVAPFSTQTFNFNQSVSSGQIEWSVINDYGGETNGISK
ncbi:fimbrial biogenesis chaperone [Ursidibacter arcticus]